MSIYNVETEGGTYQVETDDNPDTSTAGALGRGAMDAIPFATKGVAKGQEMLQGGKYQDYLDELDKLVEGDKAQHPIAHGAGEIAGAVAPFAIPGVGEALGAESMMGRAGIGAGLGALQGASATRAPLTSREGLEEIATGAGTGALLNPILGGIGDIISGAGNKVAPKLEKYANRKTVESMGIAPGKLGIPSEDIQNMGSMAHELGADTGDLETKYNTLKDALHQTGKQIEDLGEGKTLTDTVPYVNDLHQHLQDSSSIYGNEANPEATLYRQGIANLQNPEGVTFDQLQNLKSSAADRAFDKNGNITNQAAFNVYKTYSSAMEKLASDHPEYPDLKKSYSVLKDMTSGIENQFQKEQAGGSMAKGFGLAGKMGAMVTGGNVPATLGTAAALAPAHPLMAAGVMTSIATNPSAMSGAARSLANVASTGVSDAVAPALTSGLAGKELAHHAALHTSSEAVQAPKVPSQYVPVFQRELQGITDPQQRQKKMTITDFVLQSRDPNYAKAKQEQGENQEGF